MSKRGRDGNGLSKAKQSINIKRREDGKYWKKKKKKKEGEYKEDEKEYGESEHHSREVGEHVWS